MKKLFALLTLAILTGGSAQLARADEPMSMDKQEHLEQRVEHMTKALNLTPAQVPVVEAALKEKREKMEVLRKETMDKTKTIQADATSKINAVLNPEQQAKFKEMQDKFKEKMTEHREKRKEEMMKAPK